MILVRTNWENFEKYLASLTKPARKNYKEATKRYGHHPYRQVPFDRDEVARFMTLWEQQLVRGKHPQWAFPVEHLQNLADRGELMVFSCDVALHFIQRRDGYWECHPPMYDKGHSYLAKYMWFNLIRYAIENKLTHLDMGGGVDNWREMIRRRNEFPNPQYKWAYVPLRAKMDPNSEPPFYIERPSCKLLLKD